MRILRSATLMALLMLALAGCTRRQAPAAPPTSGATITTVRADGAAYTVVWIDLNRATLSLHWKRSDGTRYASLATLRQEFDCPGRRVLFTANAGIFDPSFAPCGLHVENGRQLVALNENAGTGNFYLKPNGVFLVDDSGANIMESTEFRARPPAARPPRMATQSGPLLLYRGVMHPSLQANSDNRKVRSGIGIASSGRVAYVLSDDPVTFHALARLFRDALGCTDALYLDGVISKLHAPQWGRMDDGDFAGILAVTAAEPVEAN